MQCVSFLPSSWRRTGASAEGQGAPSARASLTDIFPETSIDASIAGFVLSHIPRGGLPVLWIQDRLSLSQTGCPCLAGLQGLSLLRVEASQANDVLWAMEEGLRNRAVSAIVGEVWGNPKALDFTATKRLALRSDASGIPVWLIRRACEPDLSAARNRWRVASLPSIPDLYDPKAPGDPCWQVELFRSRQSQPGKWIARYDRAAHRLHLSSPSGDGEMAGSVEEIRRRA